MSDAPRQSGGRLFAWGVLVIVLGGVIGAALFGRPGARLQSTALPDQPPILFAAPTFTLTERSGKPLASTDLIGHVWIADFVFTSCAGPCPVMSRNMADLHKEFAGEAALRFVTFSVDPTRDTPPVLREYAKRYDADPRRWFFLTGDEQVMYALARDGFRVLARRATPAEREQPGTQEILHSPYFFLVDRRSRVRGTYDSTDEERMKQLRADVKRLLTEP